MSAWPEAWPYLVSGLVVTLQLSAICAVFTVILSAVLAVLSTSPVPLVRTAVGAYVDFFRSIPILVALIFLYFGLGRLTVTLGLSAFWVAVIVISAIESAYLSEVYRGGLNAIPSSQWDAARSLGFGWWNSVRRVIGPQAVPPALPSSVNSLISIMKDSALASLISVPEATQAATNVTSLTFQPLSVYALLTLMYIAVILPLSIIAWYLERYIAKRSGMLVHAVGAELPRVTVTSERVPTSTP